MTQLAPVALHPRADDKTHLLATVDALRAAIEAGEVICFAAVGIQEDDNTLAYMGCVGRVSRLRTLGAIAHLQACFAAGEA